LQNEFLRLRFNQLPKGDIIFFLKNISLKEGLNMSDDSIKLIQNLYGSDVRSMINFMQSNQNVVDSHFNIIDATVWETLHNYFIKREKLPLLDSYIQHVSINYNIDKKNIIKDYLNYIIRNKPELITSNFLIFIENIMHNPDFKNANYIHYALSRMKSFVPKDSDS
jgi:replication factor C subunit 3/5